MKAVLLKPGEIDFIWPSIKDGLHDALVRGGNVMPLHQLHTICRFGPGNVILMAEDADILSASVWQVETWATGPRLCCVAWYGREREKWFDLFRDAVRNLADLNGCDAVVFKGRKGHERLFPDAKVIAQVYEVR